MNKMMIKLSQLDRSKIKPPSREHTLELLNKWKEAQDELERVCKELGIAIPTMIC